VAQALAKGDLALSISEDELEASIEFTPNPGGAEWTAEKLMRVLMDARISGYNQRRAEELIQKLGRAKGKTKEIVASGEAPQEPRPELPEWCDLPIPSEYEGLARSLAFESPLPELYKVRFETVKVEKKVKKPAALPFLPPKIETVTGTERREMRERVHPDTTIVSVGWATKGVRLGILSQSKPGKPGRTIFGKPIPPQAIDVTFYSGKGVSRNRNELLAEIDGVVRIGERWIDIVPLPRHTWSVDLSSDGATCLFNYSPGDPRLPAPEAAAVRAKARDLGVPEEALLDEREIATIIADAIKKNEPLFSRSISRDRDASVEVKVSPDAMSATLSIYKGRGRGRALDLSQVSAALKSSGVRGYNAEQLKKDVLAFYKGRESELVDYPLAKGRVPSRGKERKLSIVLPFLPQEKAAELLKRIESNPGLKNAVRSLDEFPISENTKIAQVQLGQKIAELPPPEQGQDGVDVFGKVVPGIKGNDPVIKVYENIEFSKSVLTATASGVLLASEEGGGWKLRVIRFRDSSIAAEVSPDSMSATLTLTAEDGLGSPLSVEAAIAALNEKGVKYGLDAAAIADAVADARAGKPVLKRIVARGKPARPGGSAKVTWIAHKATGALYTMTAGGRADFRERDTMTRVSAGDPILKIEKAGDTGEDGIDVLGRPLPASSSSSGDQVPAHDDTIREDKSEDGSLVYTAAASGELVVEGVFGSGGMMTIRRRLDIPGDVGPETGNIKFPGVVVVKGSLRSGYTLMAGGDVSIGGSVESALLSSDGSVRVAEGVKGARRATVRSRSGFDAAFAEQALLLAVGDIRLKSGCLLCNVKTNGKLILSGEKGALIGGLCKARKGIDVAVLGSENFAKTEVSFGQDYLIADQIEAEEREIEKLKALILQIDGTMSKLEKTGAGLDQARQEKVKFVKLLEKRTMRLFDLREKFEAHFESEIRVRGVAYPGVILESHNRFFEIRSKKTKVSYSFDPGLGRIVERPL
jgi:hypothetical protein